MSKPTVEKELELPVELLIELLTPSEMRMVKNRWRIINMIREGLPVRKISELAKVGTDTVVRMSKKLQRNPNLRQHFGQSEEVNNSSRWVFGQTPER